MGTHTINIPCTASTYVTDENGQENTNFGNSVDLISSKSNGRWIFSFDKLIIDSLKNKKITKVKMYLNIKENTLNGYIEHSVIFPMYDTWDEKEIVQSNWNEYYDDELYNKLVIKKLDNGHTIECFRWNNYIDNESSEGYDFGDFTVYDTNFNDVIEILKNFSIITRPANNSGGGVIVGSSRGTHPPYLEVIYEDSPPTKPSVIMPINVFKNQSSEIKFEWHYNSQFGGKQKKFKLEWSVDNGSSWDKIEKETSDNFYLMDANVLPSEKILWRVTTYNEYDEVSPVSEKVSFFVIGQPIRPSIKNIENNARPNIEWLANNQQIYQIQILKNDIVIYDTKEIPSIYARNHKVSKFLDDGKYFIKIRIKNEYDLWSDWAFDNVNITTSKPNVPSIELYSLFNTLEIYSDTEGALVYKKINNEFIAIGKIEDGKYRDNAIANGIKYDYFVRNYTDIAFADSEIISRYGKVSNLVISDVNSKTILDFKYSVKQFNQDVVFNKNVALIKYVGRLTPVVESDGYYTKTINVEIFCEDIKKAKDLMELILQNDILLLKDKEDFIYCNISGYKKRNHLLGSIVNITATEIFFDQEIEV